MNSKALNASPPWQPLSWSSPTPTELHEITFCGAMLMSGHLAFLAILILSERADVAAWAQQDPQYYGICWFLILVKKLVPLTELQSKLSGTSTCTSGSLTCSILGFFDVFLHGADLSILLAPAENASRNRAAIFIDI